MKREEFKIGHRFKCGSRVWMCTDVGTRIISAVCLTVSRANDWARSLPEEIQDKMWEESETSTPEVDPSWLKGPPYALAESVFDEYDQQGCEAL